MADPTYVEVDFQRLDDILQFKPSKLDCAEILGVSPEAILRRIKEKTGLTFAEYRNRKMANTRRKLVKRALDMAFNGNTTMMIFCLKNYCNWSDHGEIEEKDTDEENTIQLPKTRIILMNPKSLSAEDLKKDVMRFYDVPEELKNLDATE